MPSPIGHALGGIAIAWAAIPRKNRHAAIVLAAVALAPDLDLLIGDHRGISHSVGAAVAAGVAAAALWAAFGGSGIGPAPLRWDTLRVGLAVALAWGSHVVLDWLSNDTRPPIGVMALWPMTRDYYKAGIEIFPPVSRRWGDIRFWQHNIYAAVVELVILSPLLLLALKVFTRR